jgi:DNA repair exonuclease SbcCD ATPase subunit
MESPGLGQQVFWKTVSKTFAPFLVDGPDAAEKPPDNRDALINALQVRLQAYEARVANLEKFKTYFFELKAKYTSAAELSKQLQDEVGIVIDYEHQSPVLRETLRILQEENAQLEGQLSLVEQEFNNIMRNLQVTTDRSGLPAPVTGIAASMAHIGQGVEQVKGFVSGQERQIRELTEVISELKVELSEKQRLHLMLNELTDKHVELTSAIGIIQEENGFLQGEISMLLERELQDKEAAENAMAACRRELETQREACGALEQKYVAMEREYLAAYEENKRLRG